MEKAIFTDKIFYYGIIVFISILLLYNVYSLLLNFELRLVAPIIIQIVLLILIFIKHKLIMLLLKIWSGIFLIGSFTLIILGGILKSLANGFKYFNFLDYIPSIIFLLIGIIIYMCSDRFIEISKE